MSNPSHPAGDEPFTQPVPWWVILYAFRYALGRRSYAVSDMTEWLAVMWPSMPERARCLIHRELEEALTFDAHQTQDGHTYRLLGDDHARKQWEALRTRLKEVPGGTKTDP